MSDTSPPTIGGTRYRLTRELGSGGMGRVVQVWDLQLKRSAAMKILHCGAISATSLARFRREALLMGRLRHPHLVQVYELQLEAPEPFLVMEEVHGIDLEQALLRQGCFSQERLVQVAREAGGALDCLHQASVLHRDIKPANLMLRLPEESLVVMDLGLAQDLEATALTDEGSLVGTPRFLPPEVLAGAAWVAASDQWQLGASLFHLATGLYLNSGESLQEIFSRSQQGKWQDFPAECPLGMSFRKALWRSVDPDPGRRFPSCAAFAAALQEADSGATEAPLGLVPASGISGPGPKLAEARLVGRSRALVAGVLLLFLALTLAVIRGRGKPASPQQVRWTAAGDALQVHFLGSERVQLLVEDLVVATHCEPGTRECRGEFRGIPEGEARRIGLRWPGGERGLGLVEGAAPGVSPRIEPGPGGSLLLRLFRRCRLWPLVPGGVPRELEPGVHPLEVPRPPPARLTLRWQENGIDFQRELSWPAVLKAVLEVATESHGWEEAEAIRDLLLDAPAEARDPLDRLERRWQELREWVPELLEAPLPREPRASLLQGWLAWRQLADLRTSLEGRPLPPDLAPGVPGSHGVEPPAWRVQVDSVRLMGEAPRVLRLDGSLDWGQALEKRTGVGSLEFSWPEVPAGSPTMVCLHVLGLRPTARLVLEERQGTGDFRLEFWNPRPRPSFNLAYGGYLFLVVPSSLCPPPGTAMQLRCLPLLREVGGWVEVRSLRLLTP